MTFKTLRRKMTRIFKLNTISLRTFFTLTFFVLNVLKTGVKVTILILLVLLLDQWLKFYIKLNFSYGQNTSILGFEWARLHFVENEGMAFGITFDWQYGKLLLSLFRIAMVSALVWYIRLLLREKASLGLVYSVGLITAGAIGNILDSAFYGLIFSATPVHGDEVAHLVSFGTGYADFLHGRVVDMLYFPVHTFNVPEFVPFIGGENFLFFSPIFNLADASISCGVASILIFQKWFFKVPTNDLSSMDAVVSRVEIADTPNDFLAAIKSATSIPYLTNF